jgi:hypothetical protein
MSSSGDRHCLPFMNLLVFLLVSVLWSETVRTKHETVRTKSKTRTMRTNNKTMRAKNDAYKKPCVQKAKPCVQNARLETMRFVKTVRFPSPFSKSLI